MAGNPEVIAPVGPPGRDGLPSDPLFVGGGELGRVMSARDWTATPLGAPSTWPSTLRSVVRILLTSRFSMWMAWGPDLTVLYNDAYWRDTLRSKHPWAVGRSAREVWAEIWDDIGPRIRSVLDTGEATWDEGLLLFLERSGYPEETYHTFSYSPLGDDPSHVDGMLCVVTETTERVLSERRLRILSELGDISAVTSPTVDDACHAALEVLERGHLDVPFASIYLDDPDGQTARRAGFHGMLDDERIVPARIGRDDPWPYWDVHAAGSAREITGLATTHAGLFSPLPERPGQPPIGTGPDTVVAVPLPGGGTAEPVGVLFAGVSPYRALDVEYRRFLDLAARQVATAIADADAFQAQRRRADELAELDRAKTEFFTGVSHELRTPLTLITAPAADSLDDVDHPLHPVQRDRIELIARNGGRLRRLVDTILDFARLEGGRLSPELIPVDLAALTRGIAESFSPAVTRAGLGFEVDCPPLPSAVDVDVSMWEKIVLNLLSNAVKYTHTGRVTVTLAAVPAGGVRLVVADTGIGIPEQERPLLFQRFHRVRGADGRSQEGSGIGLALVAELTALHDGRVEVAGGPGGGSAFTVDLPVTALTGAPTAHTRASTAVGHYREEALQWSDRPATAPAPATTSASDPGPTAGARVLVAEDSPDLQRFLADLLAPHYTVLLASDGNTALHVVRDELPDLVLTDVMMPGMDGFALLSELRSDPATATIPVVMLSARAGEEASAQGLAAGADDYLVKPFSSHDLLARVRSNLELSRLRNHEATWRSAMIDALQDGFYILGEATASMVEINPAMTELLGLRREHLPCGPPYPFFPTPQEDPDELGMLQETYAEAMAKGNGTVVVPLRHIETRERVWVSLSYSAMPDRDTGRRLFIATMSDVTAQRRDADHDALLAETGRLLGEPVELAERLDRFVRLVAPVLGDLAVLALPGPDGRLVPTAAAHRNDPELAERALRLPPHPLAPGHAEHYRTGTAFVLDPVDDSLPSAIATGGTDLGDRRLLGLRTMLIAPLVINGRLLGSLALGSTARTGRLDPSDLALAEELGRRLAGVVHAQQLTVRERQLQTVTAALASASTSASAAAALSDGMQEILGAARVSVYAVGDGARVVRLVHQGGDPLPVFTDLPVLRANTPPAIRAATRGEAVWVPDRQAWRRWADGAPDGIEAAAALPLVSGGTTIGVVTAGFTTTRTFPSDEREFATTVVAQAAQAFERAALADQRWHTAQTLQRALLPAELPILDGLALAARYVPAVRDTQAGGDWYDVLALTGGRVALAVGDVVGHGPAAAAVMGQLRSVLSSHLLNGHGPATALERLDHFARRIPGALGSTAACLVLDTTTGEVRWAAAGHLPPLIVDASGAHYPLGGEGTLLGLAERPPYREARTAVAPGSTVVLYTDGLVERRGEVVDDGLDRLAAVAGRNSHRGPDALAQALLQQATETTGTSDDIALVAARVLPAPLDLRLPARPATLTALRRTVEEWAETAGLAEEVLDDLQLAVGEAATNAVEHAHRDLDPGEFTCRVGRTGDGGIAVEIRDFGRWHPPGPDRGHRGRGLTVIDELAGKVRLTSSPSGTTISFHLPPVPRDLSSP